jgi:mono/diheme cytochrome c family protein
MKISIFSIAALGLLFMFSSCGESGTKLNEDQSSVSNNGKPSGADAPDFKLDMSPQNIALGKATYIETCSPCHGVGGKGDGPAAAALNPKPRDHTNGAYMDKLTNGHIFAVIKQRGASFGYPGMPMQPQLSDAKIKQVIAFVRTLSSTYHQQ